jgi:hypothetical protein
MAKSFAAKRGMQRRVKFAFSLTAAVIQYCVEKGEGKPVMSKREFVKTYYKKYLELNNSTQNSDQGNLLQHKITSDSVSTNLKLTRFKHFFSATQYGHSTVESKSKLS